MKRVVKKEELVAADAEEAERDEGKEDKGEFEVGEDEDEDEDNDEEEVKYCLVLMMGNDLPALMAVEEVGEAEEEEEVG